MILSGRGATCSRLFFTAMRERERCGQWLSTDHRYREITSFPAEEAACLDDK